MRWRYNRDVLAFAFALLCLTASDALLVAAGRPAPYLEGKTLDGNSWGAELTGQVTIVEFFASWCPHCRRSLAGYRSLVAERRVQLIIVDVEEDPALVKAFFTRNPPPGGAGILLDTDGRIRRRWGVSGLPGVFLIDQTGTVRDSFAGWGDDVARDLARQIDALNAAASPASDSAQKPAARQLTRRTRGPRRQLPQKLPAARAATPDERARQLGVEVIR
jgi:cytochrome c biogenesis protein CcmG/thiol:disulfide interchange protein DsbE